MINPSASPTAAPVGQTGFVIDTETTGFDPANGDRIIEIAAVEIRDGIRTGREFHTLINPGRDIPVAATEVHGITADMVRDKPFFEEIAGDFLAFIGDAPLVAHNADFDFKFINAELARAKRQQLDKARMKDSLARAKERFPGAQNNLDALCRRFNISLAQREKHGALIDSRLLAEVWLELNGGRQRSFDLVMTDAAPAAATQATPTVQPLQGARVIEPTEAERAAHAALLGKLKDPIWTKAA